jgi:hypothetical protein
MHHDGGSYPIRAGHNLRASIGAPRFGKGSTAMDKAIGIAFWAVVGPIILCGLVYAVGETVEHFTIQ